MRGSRWPRSSRFLQWRRAPAPAAPRRRLLGDLLVAAGALAPSALAEALSQQAGQDQRLGRILVANGPVSDDALGDALSQQSGIGRIDLGASPPDPTLFAGIDLYRCLALEAVPWRQVGGTRVIAIGSPENGEAAILACGGGAAKVALALAEPEAFRRALTESFAGRLRDDARARCPEAYRCRGWTETPRAGARCIAAGGDGCRNRRRAADDAAVAARLGDPCQHDDNGLAAGCAVRPREGRPRVEPAHSGPRLADYKKLPRVSILVPLLREEKVAQRLLDALAAMDYPAALLDIKLVLEDDDVITRAALSRAPALPRHRRGGHASRPTRLKTKPKAMNYALPFCRGDIVGVYDAEDRPDPGQIRAVVSHLQAAPPEVACVQGYLDFYNPARTGCRAASRSNTRSGSGSCCSACSVSACRSRSAAPASSSGAAARAARRLGCAQRHRGCRPRHAAGALRLPLRDDPFDHWRRPTAGCGRGSASGRAG